MSTLAPAYLFITPDAQAEQHIIAYLQKQLCSHNNCTTCTTCTQIKEKQYAQLLWLQPENRYTLDDFDPLFKKIAFTLEPNIDFFFVVEQAHLLSAACANALLKMVEEPPQGYHFIFSTNHTQHVLPTLRSRCILQTYTSNQKATNTHAAYFTQKTDPNAFLKYLSTASVTESEIATLIDFLLAYYIDKLINNLYSLTTNEQSFLEEMILFLRTATQHPVMPGSSKLFLKELYLHKNVLEQKYGKQHAFN